MLENVEKSGGLLTDGGATKFTSRVAGEKTEHGIKVGDVLYLKGKEFNLIIGDAIFAVYVSNIAEIFD